VSDKRDDAEDPAAFLSELGFERPGDKPESEGDAPVEMPAALADVRARISKDLEETQGSWHRQSFFARYWPMLAAALIGVLFIFGLQPASLTPLLLFSVVAASFAGLLAFGSVAVAPNRPGTGERLGQFAIGAGVIALGLQAAGGMKAGGGDPMGSLHGVLRCGGLMYAGALIPIVLLVFGLRRSGLPVRSVHAIGLSLAAFAVSGLALWRHCAPPEDAWHVFLAHLLLPSAGAGIVAFFVFRFCRRGGPAAL
jgi:hypothetical protein